MQSRKEKLLNKIVKKNYNNELEEVLEQKYFDENVKSNLLNILYKINVGYQDYTQVKQNVLQKDEFIKNIINIIQKDCDEIKLVKQNTEESKMLANKTFLIEKNEKRITCYPIERKLLYCISKISKNPTIIKEDYFLINKTISNLINTGNNINTVEPLRDFNGYSWTTIATEIESLEHNIIYQNLNILIGEKFLNNWVKNNEYIIDYMDLLKTKLEEKYNEKYAHQFLELIKQISILLEIKFDEKSKQEIKNIKEGNDQKLMQLEDNKKFIEQVAEEKKRLTQEIKKIDETLNDKDKLKEEYISRNDELPLEKKIFSVRILSQMMEKERDEKIRQIEEYNQLLKPKNFIKYKEELEENDKYLKLVDEDNSQKIKEIILEIQKIFLKCFEIKIKKAQTKQDIIKLIYELRYYCLIPYELQKIQKDIQKVIKELIKKAEKEKVIETVNRNEQIDYEILKNIFNIRIIKLENLYIKITKEKDKFYLQIFDEEIFEEKIELSQIENLNKKELEIKLNKKVKLFL